MNDDKPAMTCTWLHRRRASVCVVFFAGWGMDARPFAPLSAGGVDVCMLSGYQKVEAPNMMQLHEYEEVVLLAWSFGVWMAAQVCTWQLRAGCSDMIALAGTLKPVDAQLGLAPEQFEAVLANFDETVLVKFYGSMFDEEAHSALFLKNRPRRELADLKRELAFLHRESLAAPVALDMFTQHIVTSRDRIFPGRNQTRSWGRENVRVLQWPHFPFYHFATWGELLAALRADV